MGEVHAGEHREISARAGQLNAATRGNRCPYARMRERDVEPLQHGEYGTQLTHPGTTRR